MNNKSVIPKETVLEASDKCLELTNKKELIDNIEALIETIKKSSEILLPKD